MTYRAPVNEMVFMMRHVGELERAIEDGIYPDLSIGDVENILQEAARFSGEVLEPINRTGDRYGAQLRDGAVTTAPGFKEAYQAWAGAGWNALAAPVEYGGQGLPMLLNAGCAEMWNGACLAFGVAPLLTMGGVEALAAHGNEELKQRYLEKLVAGEWMATMNLTEPQAGSDLSAIRTRAEPCRDGSYRIFGQKIFISYGEHDLTDNIIHLVLARLPDAPKGTRGISLFLVPKILPDGSRNDVSCSGLEHKLGIHASPTCTMVYGDNGGARGWLLGEENRGLVCMFTMMNSARLSVALQGVAIAERACQDALTFAAERRQGASPSHNGNGMAPIIEHADVRRMLATMRGLTNAARAISYATAQAIDRSHRSQDSAERGSASERAALLTPVAKAFASDIAIEVASLGIQVHGGMGFIEETGVRSDPAGRAGAGDPSGGRRGLALLSLEDTARAGARAAVAAGGSIRARRACLLRAAPLQLVALSERRGDPRRGSAARPRARDASGARPVGRALPGRRRSGGHPRPGRRLRRGRDAPRVCRGREQRAGEADCGRSGCLRPGVPDRGRGLRQRRREMEASAAGRTRRAFNASQISRLAERYAGSSGDFLTLRRHQPRRPPLTSFHPT
jgi:acyl-CoA dehydrogenase